MNGARLLNLRRSSIRAGNGIQQRRASRNGRGNKVLTAEWKTLARRYEAAESMPDNPAMIEGYRRFVEECQRQFNNIPVKVVFVAENPYLTSRELFADIEKGMMKVYTGGNPHPLMTPLKNARFRAVHDYYGHYVNRAGFRPDGEEKAYQGHLRMFPRSLWGILKTETIAQVAVYFFGSNPGSYAVQKATIL